MIKKLNDILLKNEKYTDRGQLANYIPELGKVDKHLLGMSIISIDGKEYNIGDYKEKFTIQSISKIISLMIAVMDIGEKAVFSKVGYFGTDDPFNSYYKLENKSIPLNPMMNLGAILVTSLIEGEGEEPFLKILNMVRYITNNRDIDYSKEVYNSEKTTGHRNRGMFYLLKANNLIDEEDIILDNYFKQCSIMINARDLAKIGYFFANNCIRFDGDNRYESKEMSKLINSIMMIAGMYNNSGEFARFIGIPSKSGVGGGIVSSVPGKYGIGIFGPALDKYGNSKAGVKILKDLSEELNLSIF